MSECATDVMKERVEISSLKTHVTFPANTKFSLLNVMNGQIGAVTKQHTLCH
jgi:hypothetical protein